MATKLRSRGIRSYLASHAVRKLQIGSGSTMLDEWLCTDYEPVHGSVLYMDATRRFPFADSTFDYIITEHMIEHVACKDGLSMLHECRRVLKAGGVIRIATPDLAVLLGLYTPMPDERQREYIEWIRDQYLCGLESHGRSVGNEEMNVIETMVFEGACAK